MLNLALRPLTSLAMALFCAGLAGCVIRPRVEPMSLTSRLASAAPPPIVLPQAEDEGRPTNLLNGCRVVIPPQTEASMYVGAAGKAGYVELQLFVTQGATVLADNDTSLGDAWALGGGTPAYLHRIAIQKYIDLGITYARAAWVNPGNGMTYYKNLRYTGDLDSWTDGDPVDFGIREVKAGGDKKLFYLWILCDQAMAILLLADA